jgi:hypothetical protein
VNYDRHYKEYAGAFDLYRMATMSPKHEVELATQGQAQTIEVELIQRTVSPT